MGIRRRLALGAIGLLVVLGTAFAADKAVKIELKSGEAIEGTLVGMTGHVYTVRVGDTLREIDEDRIRSIDFPAEQPARAPAEDDSKLIDVAVEHASLRDAIAGIASDVPVFVEPSAALTMVTLSLRQVRCSR